MEWKKIFSMYIVDNGLVSRLYKDFLYVHKKTINSSFFKKGTKDLNCPSRKRVIKMVNRHRKRCSASLVSEKLSENVIQVKTTALHI